MTYRVREASHDDLSAVLALYRHLSPEDPELQIAGATPAWEALLQSPMTIVVVAEIEGAVAASCLLVMVPNLTRGARPFAIIENVVTDPDHRKKGLGTAVLSFALQAAWERGCYKVMLASGRKEEATLRFYEKAGFKRGGKTYFEVRRI